LLAGLAALIVALFGIHHATTGSTSEYTSNILTNATVWHSFISIFRSVYSVNFNKLTAKEFQTIALVDLFIIKSVPISFFDIESIYFHIFDHNYIVFAILSTLFVCEVRRSIIFCIVTSMTKNWHIASIKYGLYRSASSSYFYEPCQRVHSGR
jgi:hypothetical protein